MGDIIKNLIEREVELASQTLANGEGVIPHYSLWDGENLSYIFCPWGGEDEKREIVTMVRLKALELGATHALFVSESWTSQGPLPKGMMPSDDPNRRESLIIAEEGPDGTLHHFYEILRREDGTATLEPRPETDGRVESRMTVLAPAAIRDALTPELRKELRDIMETVMTQNGGSIQQCH